MVKLLFLLYESYEQSFAKQLELLLCLPLICYFTGKKLVVY